MNSFEIGSEPALRFLHCHDRRGPICRFWALNGCESCTINLLLLLSLTLFSLSMLVHDLVALQRTSMRYMCEVRTMVRRPHRGFFLFDSSRIVVPPCLAMSFQFSTMCLCGICFDVAQRLRSAPRHPQNPTSILRTLSTQQSELNAM